MSRKIRTATESSGKPWRRKMTLRTLTTMVLTAGTLASLAGPAQAYDESTCKEIFGEKLIDVDPVHLLDTKYVDFGDLPHTGPVGGAPQADAVACWTADQWAIVGDLFYDSPPPDYGTAWVQFWAYDPAGNVSLKTFKIEPAPGELTHRGVRYINPPSIQSHLEIRVKWQTPTGEGASGEAEPYRGGP